MKRFCYLGARNINSFVKKLDVEVKSWINRWFVQQVNFDIEMRQEFKFSRYPFTDTDDVWCVNDNSIAISHTGFEWPEILLGKNNMEAFSSALVEKALEACKRDLILRIFSDSSAEIRRLNHFDDSSSKNSAVEQWCYLDLASDIGEIRVMFPSRLFDKSKISNSNSGSGQFVREKAVSPLDVSIDVTIELNEIDIKDVMGLKPGQIIVSSKDCFKPISGKVEDATVFGGYLAKKDTRKAFVLTKME